LELIRPLLETTRVATEDHCRSIGLQPIQDPTNQDRSFTRNRLRLELIPLLETYNPALKDVVLRMGKVMRAETEFLQAVTREAWQAVVRQAGQHALAIAHKDFVGLPRAVQRSLAREAFAHLRPGVRDLGFDHVEQAVDSIVGNVAGVTDGLPGGLEIVSVGDEVLIRRTGSSVDLPQYPQLNSARARKLRSPGRLALAGGWAIHTQVTELTRDTWKRIESPARDTIAIDVRAAEDLVVRPAKRGDRLRPFGMAGSAKISDIFVNEHVPLLARARWPLVVAGGTPVWVAGLRAAEDTRLPTSAKKAVCIRLERHEGKMR
jgi:tRNA(Ile)-lysidine synthase